MLMSIFCLLIVLLIMVLFQQLAIMQKIETLERKQIDYFVSLCQRYDNHEEATLIHKVESIKL